MAVRTLLPAQALRRPRHLDVRALLGIVVLVVGTAGALLFYGLASDSDRILVASRDLSAGTTLTSEDVAAVGVRVPPSLLQASIPATSRAQVVGRRLTAPVQASQPLARTQFAGDTGVAPDQVAFTIPISLDATAGSLYVPGRDVEVLATAGKGTSNSVTTVVVPRARLYAVGHTATTVVVGATPPNGDAAGPGNTGPVTSLTLVVSPQQALDLARAKWNGDLDVALLPPVPSP